MNNLLVTGTTDFNGYVLPIICGGFGAEEKAMTDKYIAQIHDITARDVRKTINRNKDRFRLGIDYIDLRTLSNDVLTSLGYSDKEMANASNLFLFSERGYIKLVSGMNNTNTKKWEVMDAFIDSYYNMKEIVLIENINYDRNHVRRYIKGLERDQVLTELDNYIEYQTYRNADERLTSLKHSIAILKEIITSLSPNAITDMAYHTIFNNALLRYTEQAWKLQVKMQAGRLAWKTTENNELREELRRTQLTLSETQQLLLDIPNYTSIIQDDEDDLNWQIVTIHPFSVNNQRSFKGGRIVNSPEYNQWKHDADIAFRNSNIQSLEEMGVDPTKPMRITFRFCVKDKRFDTDNLVKSALDRVAAYYELGTDNNFVSVDSSKYLDTVDCFEHGEIRFAIRNLTHNEINSLLFDPIANDNTLTVY
jgi:Holliday junction resolvase RusA-like endonuclease